MGSHRRSADRVNDNSLEVSDLENEAPSSFVVPFQVPNRNDRLVVHPQANLVDRNGPYAPQTGAIYERRPRQSPYGSFTPRAYNSRRASLGGNFPRSVSGHSHVAMMSQSGVSSANRNQQPVVSSQSFSSKRARTIDLAKETQPFGTMQVSDLGGYMRMSFEEEALIVLPILQSGQWESSFSITRVFNLILYNTPQYLFIKLCQRLCETKNKA